MKTPISKTRAFGLVVGIVVALGGLTGTSLPDTSLPGSSTPEPRAATSPPGETVLDRQHTDAMSVRLVDGKLVLKTRADLDTGSGQVLDPNKVRFHVSDLQTDTVPNLPQFSFLGTPGSKIWKISQTYKADTLWAGWEAETIPAGTFAGNHISLRLAEYQGPGPLEVYMNSDEGPERVLSSTDPKLGAIHTNAGAHTHANWIFRAPGEYALTFVAEATDAAGHAVASAPQQYRFTVGGPRGSLGGGSGGTTPGTPDPPGGGVKPPVPTDPNGPTPPGTPPTPTPPPTPPPPPVTPPATPPQNTPVPTPTTPIPVAQPVDECIATPITTQVRPENVDVAESGHFDFGPILEGNTFLARMKDDRKPPAKWVDPATLVFHLTDTASAQAPGGQFAFLGSGKIWQIPLTQKSGVPWLGWNTQHESIAGKAQGNMTLTLDKLEGPGSMAVYSVDSWGQLEHRYFGTADGFPRSSEIEVGASGVHVHGIWAFTAPGAYYATMSWTGNVGGAARQGTAVLTFFVGPGDARSAVKAQTVTNYIGRTKDGADCTLGLAKTGASEAELEQFAGLGGLAAIAGLALIGAVAIRPRGTRKGALSQR